MRQSRSIVLLALCASGASLPAFGQSFDSAHRYRIEVDADLRTMRVSAEFAVPVTSIRARDWSANRYLRDARDCGRDEAIRPRNRSLQVDADGIECLHYRVDIAAAARNERRNRYLTDDNIALSPSKWLWRPEISSDTPIVVTFALPRDVRIAVPWRPQEQGGSTYVVDRSPESANAPALIGRFDYRELEIGDARLRVALANGRPALDPEATLRWIAATATDVSLTYGRFPNPSPLVVVIPVSSERRRSRSPVPFGRVIRDGGEAIELFVNATRPLEEYLEDWTATHEFSHLMVPYLHSSARWISEGFAQYYQNVLLARSGAYDQATAWRKIHVGLERGRRTRPDLSPNDAADNRRSARMKVYWSGAALALMADVELRRRSDGRESLDVVLDRLQRCCLPSERVWTGPEFFSQLDALVDEPVFMPLYWKYADEAGFPDASAVLADLGVNIAGSRVTLYDDAPLAEMRERIMQRSERVAQWRRSLAVD